MNHLQGRQISQTNGMHKRGVNSFPTDCEQLAAPHVEYTRRMMESARLTIEGGGDPVIVMALVRDICDEWFEVLGDHQPILKKPSPIERKFAEAVRDEYFDAVLWRDWATLDCALKSIHKRQEVRYIQIGHQVGVPSPHGGTYKLDFLIAARSMSDAPDILICVECDGHNFHEKSPEQALHDKRRDRHLASLGITVLRFTGREIFQDAANCAQDAITMAFARHGLTVDSMMDKWTAYLRERQAGGV